MSYIFSPPVLIRHLWQLKTAVCLNWCLISALLLDIPSYCCLVKGGLWQVGLNINSKTLCFGDTDVSSYRLQICHFLQVKVKFTS